MSDPIQLAIQEAASFVSEAVPQLERIPQLEKQASAAIELEKKMQKIAESQNRFEKCASEWTDKLVERGIVSAENKAEFVNRLTQNPDQAFAAFEKLSFSMESRPMGAGEGQAVEAAKEDPFIKYLMSK